MSAALGSMWNSDAGLTFGWAGASAPRLSQERESAFVNEQAPDDIERMKRIGGGDQRAYRSMVDLYLISITRFAERMLGNRGEAEEVAQETFLTLWTQAARWKPTAKPKTWLYRIARNQCIDRLRKRHPDAADELEQQTREGDRPSSELARKETALQIERALAALPERQRVAITLVHYEGLDGAEASEVLEISLNALESLLARGRRSLRERLRDLQTGEQP
jgi:RNA polymerase sigma-70 factor (ECF subfamily)